ncbi:MAG TPA: amylo-alpha-1,6-glucosidase [Candidatus Cybelea sp.]|nr:amylo-alpha-1,6-glucosidase [Candidatus Cybelea sp.]
MSALSRVAGLTGRPGLPIFRLTDSELGMGPSLGNGAIWINTKSTGAVERVFSNALAQSLIGSIAVRYGGYGVPAVRLGEHADSSGTPYVALGPDATHLNFELHPAYQRVSFTLGGVIDISETTFVPLDAAASAGDDTPIAYIVVHLQNTDSAEHFIRVVGSARLRGSMASDVQSRFDIARHALVAWNVSQPQAVRVFGLSEPSSRFATTFDFGRVYDPIHVHALDNEIAGVGDVLGQLQLDLALKPGQRRTICFTAGAFVEGEDRALEAYAGAPGHQTALDRTIEHLEEVLCCSQVLTPDSTINQGALWSKVNMRRVMAKYPQGPAFSNDPGNYANVVVRDSAWFVYGCDHFMPEFSRKLLENVAARQYASGKLPEYYDAVTGRIEDDGLNINDDTPLYILAVNHHFRSTGDVAWLKDVYPKVAAAARYIIAQIDDRGLVFCSANDPRGNVWSIASWRNIIELYSINGAVTEINAECVAALRAVGHLADNLGRTDGERQEFAGAAQRIQAAMDNYLINPENGLYYLNIDVDGNVHTDVTGDEIFPVIFRACDDDTGFRIISRLNAPDFWTAAGLRTVSRNDPLYDPTHYAGLMGGVWPGLTWWYAFAAARYHPEFMVRALRSSFEHYGADPKKNDTVPGQFSEWFDGESLVNRGMRLSPWEPPRFFWAVIEGVCGLMLTAGEPQINPLIPGHWSWVGIRRLRYHGGSLSYFAVRQSGVRVAIYSTVPLKSEYDVSLFESDVSDRLRVFSDSAAVIALASEERIVILLGNTESNTVSMPINVEDVVDRSQSYQVRVYNSEKRDWEAPVMRGGEGLTALAVLIEANGFRLLELTVA